MVEPTHDAIGRMGSPESRRCSIERARGSFEFGCRSNGPYNSVTSAVLALVVRAVYGTRVPRAELAADLFEVVDSGDQLSEKRVRADRSLDVPRRVSEGPSQLRKFAGNLYLPVLFVDGHSLILSSVSDMPEGARPAWAGSSWVATRRERCG
jgi:hypothetical protein